MLQVVEPAPGIPFARNTAVRTALQQDAELLAFLDDDDLPEGNWLVALLERRRTTAAAVVLGTSRHADAELLPSWARHLRYFAPATLDRLNPFGIPVRAATSNVLIEADLLRRMAEAGPVFRPEFRHSGGEDTDFFVRARAAGAELAVARQSVVLSCWDPTRLHFRGVLRRGLKLGTTRYRLQTAHGAPASVWARRRLAFRKLRKSLRRLLRDMWRPDRRPDAVVRIAEDLGEMMAAFGHEIGYYSRTA